MLAAVLVSGHESELAAVRISRKRISVTAGTGAGKAPATRQHGSQTKRPHTFAQHTIQHGP